MSYAVHIHRIFVFDAYFYAIYNYYAFSIYYAFYSQCFIVTADSALWNQYIFVVLASAAFHRLYIFAFARDGAVQNDNFLTSTANHAFVNNHILTDGVYRTISIHLSSDASAAYQNQHILHSLFIVPVKTALFSVDVEFRNNASSQQLCNLA